MRESELRKVGRSRKQGGRGERSRGKRRKENLRREDVEVDAGEALEVLLEQPLGVVLADLLSRHRLFTRSDERREEGRGALCSAGHPPSSIYYYIATTRRPHSKLEGSAHAFNPYHMPAPTPPPNRYRCGNLMLHRIQF